MSYLTSFYCLLHTAQAQVFDDNKHKPMIGSCGHMICLECLQNQNTSSCPLCQKENVFDEAKPNYAAIGLINQSVEDIRSSMKLWLSGNNYREGLCSKCVKTKPLRICLTCHRDELCESHGEELKLRMRSEEDLVNLARHAICSDCFIENPAEKGHRSVKIDDIKHSKEDIEAISTIITTKMFAGVTPKEISFIQCKLRIRRQQNMLIEISKLVQPLGDTVEVDWGYLGKQIKVELLDKYTYHFEKNLKELFNKDHKENPLCECTILYDKIERLGNEEGLRIYVKMADWVTARITPGCPLWFKSHKEDRLKLYNMIGETPPEKATLEPSNDSQCPTCNFLDHSEHNKLSYAFDREVWTNIIKTIWKSEMPDINDCCIPCLEVLNRYEVGSSCKQIDKQENIEKMGTEESFKYEIYRLLIEHLERNEYSNYIERDQKIDSVIKIYGELFVAALEIVNDSNKLDVPTCELQYVRIEHMLSNLLNSTSDIVFRADRRAVTAEVAALKHVYETFKAQWNMYKNGSQSESPCECTVIWEKNKEMLKQLQHENYDARRKYHDLENKMMQMALHSIDQDIGGCPMYFDHGIVLDALVLKELDEWIILESVETLENMDFDLD